MIAYLVNQYPKVSHSFIRREILALERSGQKVRRFAMRGWDAQLVDQADIAERDVTTYLLRGGGWPLVRATLVWLISRPGGCFSAFRQTMRMVRRSDRSLLVHAITLFEACLMAVEAANAGVRHIHAHFGTNSAEVAMLVSLLTGIPYSFTVHGPDEFDKPEFIKLRDKVHHAKFVVAISDYCASQIFRWADLADWRKVKIVRCGLDQDYMLDRPQEPSRPDRLVCVGRISTQKGHMLLVAAACKVVKGGRSLELVLVGDGELRPEVEAFVRSNGLERVVRITGWASGEEVRREILESRGLILTSFAEGLPVVIMEAMALGRVVLATHIAGIPELVRPGETGWLFRPGSVEAAAEAIQECISTPANLCHDMGERGRIIVGERHDLNREVAYLARLFESDPDKLAERQHE
jgi:colanic acid/amylovoran biosynthesis glycosyltransferase